VKNSLVHIVAARLGYGLQHRRAEQTFLSADAERVQRLGHEVVDNYEQQAAFVRKLAEVYGFKVWFFWQPIVYTRKQPTALERTFSTEYGSLMPEVYRAATTDIRGRNFAIDLSTSFDNESTSIYIDWAHVSERGNEIVAQQMYSAIRPMLPALVASPAVRDGAQR
jgi:hypothetical protein